MFYKKISLLFLTILFIGGLYCSSVESHPINGCEFKLVFIFDTSQSVTKSIFNDIKTHIVPNFIGSFLNKSNKVFVSVVSYSNQMTTVIRNFSRVSEECKIDSSHLDCNHPNILLKNLKQWDKNSALDNTVIMGLGTVLANLRNTDIKKDNVIAIVWFHGSDVSNWRDFIRDTKELRKSINTNTLFAISLSNNHAKHNEKKIYYSWNVVNLKEIDTIREKLMKQCTRINFLLSQSRLNQARMHQTDLFEWKHFILNQASLPSPPPLSSEVYFKMKLSEIIDYITRVTQANHTFVSFQHSTYGKIVPLTLVNVHSAPRIKALLNELNQTHPSTYRGLLNVLQHSHNLIDQKSNDLPTNTIKQCHLYLDLNDKMFASQSEEDLELLKSEIEGLEKRCNFSICSINANGTCDIAKSSIQQSRFMETLTAFDKIPIVYVFFIAFKSNSLEIDVNKSNLNLRELIGQRVEHDRVYFGSSSSNHYSKRYLVDLRPKSESPLYDVNVVLSELISFKQNPIEDVKNDLFWTFNILKAYKNGILGGKKCTLLFYTGDLFDLLRDSKFLNSIQVFNSERWCENVVVNIGKDRKRNIQIILNSGIVSSVENIVDGDHPLLKQMLRSKLF